jgi:hypothetical protein
MFSGITRDVQNQQRVEKRGKRSDEEIKRTKGWQKPNF